MTDVEPSPDPISDHDTPWKEALEGWFPEFLALLFPAIHAEIDMLLWLIEKKFGPEVAQANRARVETAETDTLRAWSERILTAETVEAVFG